MKHTPRSIRMDREKERLERVAQERGYPSADIMIAEMYLIDFVPLEQIAHTLFTPIWSLRKRFDHLGIPVRGRGGRNNVRVEITEELVREVARDGISMAALRLGVDYLTLSLHVNKWLRKQQEETTL